ncbi:MAG: proline dehydrogenase family protein [Terrimesophilobacter sp.]
MDVRDLALPMRTADLADEATKTVRRWLDASQHAETPRDEARLATLLSDPDGPAFARGLVDGLLRPTDAKVAAHNLERLSRDVPDSVRWHSEIGTQLAGGFAPLLSAQIVPLVVHNLLRTVGGMFVRLGARDPESQLAQLRGTGGVRTILAPVTSDACGHRQANRQLADARDLISRKDVDAISVSLPQLFGRLRLIDIDQQVAQAVDQLASLYELASSAPGPKFINLEVERLHELEPTVRVFQELCERYPQLEAGITLPANLPESLSALERITQWAARGEANAQEFAPGSTGSYPRIVVRLVKGDHGGDEHAEAAARGWPSAAFTRRVDTDAHYLRLLDASLTRSRCTAVRVIIATHNLFDVAYAWRLARDRGVERSVEYEFMLGLNSAQADAVKRDVGGIRRYVPVVQHGQLALVVPYLMRRLDDLTSSETFLGAREIAADTAQFAREDSHFREALHHASEPVAASFRHQGLLHAEDTDLTVRANRDWAHTILMRSKDSAGGEELLAQFSAALASHSSTDAVDAMVAKAVMAGTEWGQRRGTTRAAVLDSVADTLAEWRGPLIETAVSESGLTFEEADREVTLAIDAARHTASRARGLDSVDGAQFVPSRLIVVVAPRVGPIAAPAASMVAALAAGSAVIVKAAPETQRSVAVLIQVLRAAGVPSELMALVCDEGEIAERLLRHHDADRILFAGSRHTAKLFHSWDAELELQATIGGRNSVIVTPNADLEAAVADVVEGAFDHAGQANTAANVVILVGSVATGERFRGRLRDAVSSRIAGPPDAPATELSSLVRPAAGAALASLDELADGETWLVRPSSLGSTGRLWAPGLRDGVTPGSTFHTRESRAPVLGIMTAHTLDEAIEIQNVLGFGLTAGIQSTDAGELSQWLHSVEAGMLFVNLPVVPGIRSRMPFGGWGRSHIGQGRMAGGPDELHSLGNWAPVFGEPGTAVTLNGVSKPVVSLVEAAQPSMSFIEFDRVRTAAKSDERVWRADLAVPHELSDGTAERNVLRYRPVPVTIRLAEGAPVSQLVRSLAAAALAGSAVAISSSAPLPAPLITLFSSTQSPVAVAEVLIESAARWHARLHAGAVETQRIRLIGGDPAVLARVLHGRPGISVHGGPITTNGRAELLVFLREQSVCAAASRYGLADHTIATLPLTSW